MARRPLLTFTVFAFAAVAVPGCKPYRLAPPTGFAEVHADRASARLKAGDDVGLNVKVFDNVRGGTLAFWSEDLVRKLAERGYTLQHQRPVESDNRRPGTRFDFSYETRDGAPKFYSVLLFVTDEHKVVVEIAGRAALADRYLARLDEIARTVTVRGCRPWTEICEGPQPPSLVDASIEARTPKPAAEAEPTPKDAAPPEATDPPKPEPPAEG